VVSLKNPRKDSWSKKPPTTLGRPIGRWLLFTYHRSFKSLDEKCEMTTEELPGVRFHRQRSIISQYGGVQRSCFSLRLFHHRLASPEHNANPSQRTAPDSNTTVALNITKKKNVCNATVNTRGLRT
jgi:hypothetical protein